MMKKDPAKTKKLSLAKEIIFLREFRGVLSEIPAELIGESAPRCAVCHEAEKGHARNGRRHTFVPETGMTIVVNYPDQEPETRDHVMQGEGANNWKEK